MEKRTMMFSLAMVLFLFSFGAADRLTSKVDNKLNFLNKPAVKSIKSEDGDIVDCVDIDKQHAFDHPALRNHKIQMKPSFELLSEAPSPSIHVQNDLNASQLAFTQTWQKTGSCPEGTIPIRRIRRQDLLRARSLEHFGKKPSLHSYSRNGDNGIVLMNGTRVGLGPDVTRSAAIIITQGQNYIGAEGIINLWNPRVEGPDEFTSAQIWMKNGPGDAFESVESGWMVNPQLYGDTASRLFVYWTSDAYKSKGCFDLTCPGFVQTNKNIALGMALKPISSAMGPQYEGIYSILQDTYTGNWWLSLGADIRVGYWPGELFHYLTYSAATLVEWGGEVYSYKVKQVHPHTATDMGSGAYAEGKFRNACYIRQIRIVNYSKRYPIWVIPFTDEKSCYTALNDPESPAQDPVFYFGGPGQNLPNCP